MTLPVAQPIVFSGAWPAFAFDIAAVPQRIVVGAIVIPEFLCGYPDYGDSTDLIDVADGYDDPPPIHNIFAPLSTSSALSYVGGGYAGWPGRRAAVRCAEDSRAGGGSGPQPVRGSGGVDATVSEDVERAFVEDAPGTDFGSMTFDDAVACLRAMDTDKLAAEAHCLSDLMQRGELDVSAVAGDLERRMIVHKVCVYAEVLRALSARANGGDAGADQALRSFDIRVARFPPEFAARLVEEMPAYKVVIEAERREPLIFEGHPERKPQHKIRLDAVRELLKRTRRGNAEAADAVNELYLPSLVFLRAIGNLAADLKSLVTATEFSVLRHKREHLNTLESAIEEVKEVMVLLLSAGNWRGIALVMREMRGNNAIARDIFDEARDKDNSQVTDVYESFKTRPASARHFPTPESFSIERSGNFHYAFLRSRSVTQIRNMAAFRRFIKHHPKLHDELSILTERMMKGGGRADPSNPDALRWKALLYDAWMKMAMYADLIHVDEPCLPLAMQRVTKLVP